MLEIVKKTGIEEEVELIKLCQKSDHKAFKILYDKYAGKMTAIASRYCNTSFEAEDVIQEVFINVFNKIKSFKHQGSFEGWLRRMVVNYAINHYHKTAKLRNHLEVSEYGENHQIDSGHYKEIVDRLSEEEIITVIQNIPDGYKTVFNLYEIEGYSHKEIGEKLGISDGTSKSQLFKAKKMLQELLEEYKVKVAHGG